ncbi:MAG TPA: single-stranded DNA-specific exonuclease [Thermoplasmatales archaeon]|nr:single-stranded DNA-specific exonuclease [Thermoplasmatales archaeon]
MRLIIHHWDTDGICSASMLYEEGDINVSPKIGNYFLEDDEIERVKNGEYDEIVVVDIALNPDTMKKLVEISKVKVFDHHHTTKVENIEYINPIIEGMKEEEWPSASWVVATHMNKTDNFLAFLGVVGDWEDRIKNTSFYPFLEGFMKKHELNLKKMCEMAYIIDANYKIGDKAEVEKTVRLLHNSVNPADFIMSNRLWKKRKMKIEEEIEKAVENEEKRIGRIIIKEIDSPYNIISTVARKIWKGKEYVVVVNCGYFKDDCQVYVRGKDAIPLIKMALTKGYVAGGKKNVMGAIVPKEKCKEFVEKIVEMVK